MTKIPKLSIVIPAYNESENFKRGAIDQVKEYLSRQKFSWEVILVNDGSTDNTLALLNNFAKKNPGFRVLDIHHGGKVKAVTAGVMDSRGKYILFTDFDQSTPSYEIDKVLKAFSQGADVVIGKRKSEDMNWTTLQKIRSKIFNLLTQLIVLPGISDTQCGFKAFKNEVGKKLFNMLKVTKYTQKDGYMGAFDVELLFLARNNRFKIIQIPVSWKYFESKRLQWSEPIKMLRDILFVRLINLPHHFLTVALLLLLTIPAVKGTMAPGYFRMHDDLQATRQLVMDKCFKEGQIPCRWSQDLGYGFGYPLFNFYPPLPYYFGQVIHWLGFSFTDTVKVLVVLNFFVSGLLMYLLAQAFWGRWGGFISGLLYVYAPYHAVDVYVRAAINEAWALAWFPAIFWSIYKLIETEKWRYVPLLSVFVAFLMLSHNPMLMIFAPGALIWTLYWLIQKRKLTSLLKLIASGLWALGLAGFFTLPVLFEQKYAHIETLVIGYFNYLAHFANINQLFISRNWGYGDSRFGPVDDISFQIGFLHWIGALVSLFVALLVARKKPKIALMIILVFGLTLFYTFLTHEKSSPIWSSITQLQYLQFPWRFLTLSIFGTSFLAGSLMLLVKTERLKIIFSPKGQALLIIFIIIINFILYKDYFRWKDYWPWVTDEVKFSGELWRLQITSGIFDYLPRWAPLPPADPPKGDANLLGGEGHVEKLFKNSIKQEYKVSVKKSGVFQLETFYFPGWQYFVDGKEVSVNPEEDEELGRPRIKLSPGEYTVIAKFTNTPVRTIGNSLSLISWALFIGFVLYNPYKKPFKKIG